MFVLFSLCTFCLEAWLDITLQKESTENSEVVSHHMACLAAGLAYGELYYIQDLQI